MPWETHLFSDASIWIRYLSLGQHVCAACWMADLPLEEFGTVGIESEDEGGQTGLERRMQRGRGKHCHQMEKRSTAFEASEQ